LLRGNSSLTVENGILGTNFPLSPVPGMTALETLTRSGYSSSSASPSSLPSISSSDAVNSAGGKGKPPKTHVRKFEALEDPLVTIMNRYILLEEKKMEMEIARETRRLQQDAARDAEREARRQIMLD
jgi:hypothetical protein